MCVTYVIFSLYLLDTAGQSENANDVSTTCVLRKYFKI